MTQFLELCDASSKPWTQLSSFTALVFLLLTQNCSGLPQVVGPSQPVQATVGADVLLSCRLEPAVDASGMSIEWSREGLDRHVYVRSEGDEQESLKHRDYKGRTSLLFSQLEFGNISLKLSNVKPFDKGKYRCFLPTLGLGSTIELVVGIDPIPVISVAGPGRTSGSVELKCESAGWYPKPEVLWLDADGNLLSAGPTETVRGPDGFYNVSSRLTVEKKHSNKFTCRVQQNNITHRREALIQVTDDFFKVQSSKNSTIVGLAVSLTAAFILLILAVFLFVRTRREKKTLVNKQNELQQEKKKNETLQNELEESNINHLQTKYQLQLEKQEKETLQNQLEESKINHLQTKYQLQLEKQKNENLENELEEGTTMMSEVLLNILDDLDDDELSRFQGFVPAIRNTPDRCNTVDVMVQTYGPWGAVQVTWVVLEKISRKDLLERLAASSSGPEGYGNIIDVETTGASDQWDQLGFKGERSSHMLAEMDSERMEKYRSIINEVGRKYNIEPALIAAIISRKSRAGHELRDGWAGYKCWGLMQVSTAPNWGGHEARGAWDSEEHLCQGTEILVGSLIEIRNKFPSWTREQQLKGGIAAYMAGSEKVHSYENVDENTEGEDFSNDVVARAQWYKENFFKQPNMSNISEKS